MPALVFCLFTYSIKANPTGHEFTLNFSDANFSASPFHDSKSSIGADYKYHLNIGSGIFVAGGVYYDHLDLEDSVTTTSLFGNITTIVSVDNTYGTSLDVGYDYSKEFTSYIGLTYSYIDAGITNNFRGNQFVNNRSDYNLGFLVGGKYNFNNSFSAIISYNNTEFSSGVVSLDLELIKLGISYNF